MKKLAGDKNMSKDEILDLMKSKLGVMSQRKMEDMIREGYSAEEIIQHLMTHGKTQEQETKLFTRRRWTRSRSTWAKRPPLCLRSFSRMASPTLASSTSSSDTATMSTVWFLMTSSSEISDSQKN